MKNLKETTDRLLGYFNFRESRAEYDEERKRVSIYIDDEVITSKDIPTLINCFNKVLKLVAKKHDEGPIMVDVNNHHKEREKLVMELAKAGAKKSATTKADVVLPPMNSFERHLVHEELSIRPDVRTESIGEGASRRVVIKYIE
jgi:spoIIIJ-associated protein